MLSGESTDPKKIGRRFSSMTLAETVMAATMMAAPPTPATARPAMKVVKFCETAAMREPSSKMEMAAGQLGVMRSCISARLTDQEGNLLLEPSEGLAPQQDGRALCQEIRPIVNLKLPLIQGERSTHELTQPTRSMASKWPAMMGMAGMRMVWSRMMRKILRASAMKTVTSFRP